MYELLTEAVIIGLIVVLVGVFVSEGIKMIGLTDIKKECEDWNKYHIMEVALFLTGAISHVLVESFVKRV